jgi:hypothetical protein
MERNNLNASDVPDSLGALDLASLQKDGTPPESRMVNVTYASSIYSKLESADEEASNNRAKVDAMYDGVAPYDQSVLKSTGQGARTNLNWGEAQRLLDINLSAYVDLYESLGNLVRVKLQRTVAGDVDRVASEDIIANEITREVRNWPQFHSSYLRLCTEFTKHGAGFTYFDDAKSWKFRVAGLSQFLFPRQCRADEDSIEVSAVRFPYMLHELYHYVRSEDKVKGSASDQGWNVEEIKRVIIQNAKNDTDRSTGTLNWEQAQRELKNNDLLTGLENTTVDVIHMWVKEFDGSVTFCIFAKDSPRDFLFKKNSAFKTAQEAYVAFTQGVGTNGTFHSIRGQGQRIFAHIQMSNRIRCQMVDSAMLAGSVMIQPDSERSLSKLSYTMYGPYSILPPQLNIVEKKSPDLGRSMQPALQDVSNQLAMNADPASIYQQQASPYRNDRQVEHELAVASRLTGSTLNLFYSSWGRLWKQIVRRIVADKNSETYKNISQRLAERGVDPTLLGQLDLEATGAVRAIGNGSKTERLSNLRELYQTAGESDEFGRLNLNRDITSHLVGHDLVDRYAKAAPEPRTTNATKIALMENNQLLRGDQVPVLSEEPHSEHIRAQSPQLQQLVAGIESGEVDPMQALQSASVLHDHVAQHNAQLVNDKSAQQLYKATEQLLQQSKEIIVNFSKRLAKMQREAAEQQAEMGGAPEGQAAPQAPAPEEIKYRDHQIKMQIAQEKASQEMRIKEMKARQDLALSDAKAAKSL